MLVPTTVHQEADILKAPPFYLLAPWYRLCLPYQQIQWYIMIFINRSKSTSTVCNFSKMPIQFFRKFFNYLIFLKRVKRLFL